MSKLSGRLRVIKGSVIESIEAEEAIPDSNMVADNLLSPVSPIWRSTDTGTQKLTCSLALEDTDPLSLVEALALYQHNLGLGTTLILTYYEYLDRTGETGTRQVTATPQTTYVEFDTPFYARLVDISIPVGSVEIDFLILGSLYIPYTQFEWGSKIVVEDKTKLSRTRGASYASTTPSTHKNFKIRLPYNTLDTTVELISLLFNSRHEYMYIVAEPQEGNTLSYPCLLDGLTVTELTDQNFSIVFDALEAA